ncbi:helix-turn-helix transcriptional regulator [bacterium]|nr:helix-turn-helix transcriptional regulator [bacterium]
MKSKPIIETMTSEKVGKFLEKNQLHKKDFAEMIGVTLSYVYNLIDNTIPFSTRTTTLERIATVMDVSPEEFDEYKISQEPVLIDETIDFLKDSIKQKGLSVVNFLKSFPRKKRLELVDILRGATPIPIDFKELSMIAQVLDLSNADIYPLWEKRMRQVLEINGMNASSNDILLNKMFDCAKKHIISE